MEGVRALRGEVWEGRREYLMNSAGVVVSTTFLGKIGQSHTAGHLSAWRRWFGECAGTDPISNKGHGKGR